jgi:hypothetical protein
LLHFIKASAVQLSFLQIQKQELCYLLKTVHCSFKVFSQMNRIKSGSGSRNRKPKLQENNVETLGKAKPDVALGRNEENQQRFPHYCHRAL